MKFYAKICVTIVFFQGKSAKIDYIKPFSVPNFKIVNHGKIIKNSRFSVKIHTFSIFNLIK